MLPNGKIVLLLVSIALVCRTIAQDDPYRLPPNYKLEHYDINLVIPAESFTANSSNYSGSVVIQFQVTVNTSEVKLHASSSNINLLAIQLDDDGLLEAANYSINSTTNILTLQLADELIVGQSYNLCITFNSSLVTSSGRALFKTSYTDDKGVTQYIAATQFEPINARHAFPCFDEPRYKATFAYTLTYPADMNALANTASASSSTDQTNNLTTTVFEVTPRMSVYLVAFVISKYTCTEGALEGSATAVHRICSRQERESRRSYALKVTPLIIDGLNNYTGINYTNSLGKLDQVAVSGKSGAMENWGLVLYSEGGLLFDNTVQTNTNKQGILTVIAHELAHQWFGNLVTCKWWSEIFLNEGLATLFEYYIADEAQPVFQTVNQFVIRIMHGILTTDGSLNVPALRSNASTAAEISSKFSRYSYHKGAAVLRMIEHVVGQEYFRSGIQKYLTDNQYEPAEPEDLWDAIQAVTGNQISTLPLDLNISAVMYNWIEMSGYPVVNVSLNGTTLVLTQQRFLYSGSETEKTTWYIPISYTTSEIGDCNEDTSPRGWITPTEDLTITGFTNSSAWLVVNNQQTGFFRVNYDATLWENLAVALQQTNFSGIHVLNRAQIIQDSYMLARAGLLSFDQVLRNSEFLVNDNSYITWYPGMSFLNYLLSRIGSTSTLGASLTRHFLALVETVANSVPLETVNEDEQVYTLNQVLVNTYACKYGNAVCTAAAKRLFATYKATFERPNINTRALVYCNAIRHSESPTEDWNFLFEQYQNGSVSDDSSRIWAALGCPTNTTVLNAFVDRLFKSDKVITSSLYTLVFSTIFSANEVGVDFVLDYFISNYQKIIDLYAAADLSPAEIITGLGSVFTREDQIEKLESFVASTSNLSTTITEAAATARTRYTSNQAVVVSHRSALNGYFGITEDDESVTTTSTAIATPAEAATTTTSSEAATTTTPATASIAQSTTTTTAQTDAAVSLRSIGLLSLMLALLVRLTC